MPMMNVFEPLFLLLTLATVVSLVTAAVLALRGRFARAGRILRRVAIGAALYFAVAIVVSVLVPRQQYRVGDLRCFDDWCITVAEVKTSASDAGRVYEVSLRLSNRARGRAMGEKGTVAYLTDAAGRRYDPLRDPDAVRFDTVLQPGESVVAIRGFAVPADARDVGLVYTHEGGFPIQWFIIGEGGWFQKPAIVNLD
jgi:hypothetical protein